jgi:hypothetical protein
MLVREQRGLLLSGLALLLVLPAMLLVASYFRMVKTGSDATAAQIEMDKVNYAMNDIERIIKYMTKTGQPFDNATLARLADNYRVSTGLLVDISGLDSDNDNVIDTAMISVQDPNKETRYSTTLPFTGLSVMIFPDLAYYRPGDKVTITVFVGNMYGVPQKAATVNENILNPSGIIIYSVSGLTDNSGSWENSFTLSSAAELGQYLIIADANSDSRTGSNNITFEVKHDIQIQIIDPDKDQYGLGENENVIAVLTDETGARIVGAYVEFEILDSYYSVVDGPVVMYDDGQHFDSGADDGIYGESWGLLPSLPENYYYVRVYAMKEWYNDNFADKPFSVIRE